MVNHRDCELKVAPTWAGNIKSILADIVRQPRNALDHAQFNWINNTKAMQYFHTHTHTPAKWANKRPTVANMMKNRLFYSIQCYLANFSTLRIESNLLLSADAPSPGSGADCMQCRSNSLDEKGWRACISWDWSILRCYLTGRRIKHTWVSQSVEWYNGLVVRLPLLWQNDDLHLGISQMLVVWICEPHEQNTFVNMASRW